MVAAGMTKTLHLYEEKFTRMLEDAQANTGGLLVSAVLEPLTDAAQQVGLRAESGQPRAALSAGCGQTV